MNSKPILFSLLAGFAFAPVVDAQDQKIQMPVVPTTIASVASGGHWEADGKYGTYQVIVESAGWEHVMSRVHIQWIEDDPNQREAVIYKSATIKEVSWNCTLDAPKFTSRKTNHPIVRITGVEPHSDWKCLFILELGTPGVYRILKKKIGKWLYSAPNWGG